MDPPTGPDSTQKDLTVGELWCREYCSGNLATWYCPQCSAIFCASCYDREHRGNERKANHRRITSIRPVCNEHKHTLDFFDWTSLSPLCVICKENLTESSDHLVDKIELVLPKLRRLVQEKLDKSRLLYKRISNSFTAADTEADKTAARAFDQLRYCFQEARNILDRREAAVQKKIKKLCESFKNSPSRVSVQTQLRILTGLISEGEALLNKDPGQFAEDFTPFYSHFNALYMSLDECKPPAAFRLNITLGRNTLEQINRLGEVMLRTDKKVEGHLSHSEVTHDQVMVDQDRITSMSPLLSSTAGFVTPLRSPVPFGSREPSQHETGKIAMVAATEPTGKRQVPKNADQILSGTTCRQIALVAATEPTGKRQVPENSDQLLSTNETRQIALVAAIEPAGKRQVSENAGQLVNGTSQMPRNACSAPSGTRKMACDVSSLPGAARLYPVSPERLVEACGARDTHQGSSPVSTGATHIQQGTRPASCANMQTPQAPSLVPIGTGQSGQKTSLEVPHETRHSPGDPSSLPVHTRLDTSPVWHRQTSPDTSHRQTPQEASPEPCEHKQTPQDASPEYPPLHRLPAARKCIEAQFAKLKFNSAETGTSPQSNFETETKKQKSSRKSKQAASGRTRTPENSKHPSRKRTTPKMAEDPQCSSSCKRRRRGDELSREFSKCDEILTEMWASEDSFPFVHPVDKKKFPDYYAQVRKPMDMTYIKDKLHSLRYESVVDFVKDVHLIFQNCRSYNQPTSFTTEAAIRLEDLFRKLTKARFPNFHEIFPISCSTP